MIQGIDRAAITQSISIITACSYHNPALESAYLQMALEHHYLGVIFLYPPDNDAAYANANTRIPIVTICDRSSHVTGDIVELNNFEAGVLAARSWGTRISPFSLRPPCAARPRAQRAWPAFSPRCARFSPRIIC